MSVALFDLSGRTAVVTGAGRGLGKAIAVGLAAAGAKVAVGARTRADVEATARDIEARGGEALAVAFDATARDDCRRLIDETAARFGGLDVAVAAHGVIAPDFARAEDVGGDEFARVVAINLTGAFHCAQAAAQRMIASGAGGSIILVSSTASLVGFPRLLAYGASKGGVDQMARQMAVEWGDHGIRVNVINPGYTTHHMRGSETEYEDPDYEAHIRARTPLRRRGTPEEFVGPAVFLASEASSFVTGATLVVDGGYCAL